MDMSLLIAAAASFLAGLLGYIIVRIWIKPVLHYIISKRRLDHELTRCLAMFNDASAVEKHHHDNPGNAALRNARKHAMEMLSCYTEKIPYWYRLLLDSRKESPTKASGLLSNLSKIRDREQIIHRIEKTRKTLQLK